MLILYPRPFWILWVLPLPFFSCTLKNVNAHVVSLFSSQCTGRSGSKKKPNLFYRICHGETVSPQNRSRKQPLPAPDLSNDICYTTRKQRVKSLLKQGIPLHKADSCAENPKLRHGEWEVELQNVRQWFWVPLFSCCWTAVACRFSGHKLE